MTFTELEAEVRKLKGKVEERISEDIKYRRMLDDLISNLTFDNMPSIKKELKGGIEKISHISGDIDGIYEGISSVEQRVDEQGAEIALVVSKKNGVNTVNTASIVSAINKSGSSIKMSADKISFDGSSVTFDTDTLKVNSEGCVEFYSPVRASSLYAGDGYFDGRVDFGSAEGLRGYAYINGNESNGIEIVGDGGIVLSTDAESGNGAGNVDIYADNMSFNGCKVLTDSDEDIAYLRVLLGL